MCSPTCISLPMMFLALYILPVFPFDFSFAHEDSLGTRLVTANAVRTVFNQPQFLLVLSLFLEHQIHSYVRRAQN